METEKTLAELVDEYYALDREKADLERRTKKKKEELETAMGLAGVQKAFGTEVGYSMSIRPKVTYDPKVWQLLGEKAELFREEPKITQKRIDELLKEGDITKADLDAIN